MGTVSWFVSKRLQPRYDLCVKCGEKTMYEKNVHIDRRMGYVEGAGQLCVSCDKEFTEGEN